jgi:hypothetical protein
MRLVDWIAWNKVVPPPIVRALLPWFSEINNVKVTLVDSGMSMRGDASGIWMRGDYPAQQLRDHPNHPEVAAAAIVSSFAHELEHGRQERTRPIWFRWQRLLAWMGGKSTTDALENEPKRMAKAVLNFYLANPSLMGEVVEWMTA